MIIKEAVKMNYKKSHTSFSLAILLLMAAALLGACKKYLPQERETVGADSQFTVFSFEPVLGRTTYFNGNFFKGSTTYPADFKIVNPRRRNGDAAPELENLFPVKVWKKAYDGNESSLAEIEAKREVQYRPIFEISPHTGDFTMWAEGRTSFMRPQPDSGYLFDVEVTNSGGRRYYRDLKLMPMRERPYEPSNYNAISGQPLSNGVFPSSVNSIKGVSTNRYLAFFDIDVYIRKLETAASNPGHTITFKFLDTLYNPIDPALFSATNWDGLLHGFNRKMTSTSVTYSVAYPIPLVELPTRFTSPDGRRARVQFAYSRSGFGGAKEDAVLGLDFAIYEPGNWEIVFAFKNDNPKFEND